MVDNYVVVCIGINLSERVISILAPSFREILWPMISTVSGLWQVFSGLKMNAGIFFRLIASLSEGASTTPVRSEDLLCAVRFLKYV